MTAATPTGTVWVLVPTMWSGMEWVAADAGDAVVSSAVTVRIATTDAMSRRLIAVASLGLALPSGRLRPYERPARK